MKEIAIIGGGLAGLISAISLKKAGKEVVLFEKKKYPFHKVCGEYLSSEIVQYLVQLGIDVPSLGYHKINKLHLSAPNGNDLFIDLQLGAISVSRYKLDHFLFEYAKKMGVECFDKCEIKSVRFMDNQFSIIDGDGREFKSMVCIGSYGRRSALDRKLDRSFFKLKTGYVGVKSHFHGDFPEHLVGLHNIRNGYCGISKIEDNKVNVCYLTTSSRIRQYANLDQYEQSELYSNPHIKSFLKSATPLFKEPVVVSQMYFGKKENVSNHILMCGDASGTIAPLTGNGMAMAITSSILCKELILEFLNNKISRFQMEERYSEEWQKMFKRRMFFGNNFQTFFGKPFVSSLSISVVKRSPWLMKKMISLTHG